MSLIPIGTSVAIAAAEQLISQFFLRQTDIGGIIPDITVEEVGTDELVITEHPVEQGATISDHAYKRQVECTIRAGFSNSSLQAGGNPNYVVEIYQQLLALQASRQPFSIITFKRSYDNMLIRRLTPDPTTAKTTDSMIITCECREVILVSTQTVSVPPAANQKNPELNSAETNTGQQTLQPAPNFNATAAPAD